MGIKSYPSVSEILANNGKGSVSDNIDNILINTGIGSIQKAMGNNFYGINHRQTPPSISVKKDYYGMTFFTRPRLNMTTDNLGMARQMFNLATTDQHSLQRIIRCYLDPELETTENLTAPLVDNYSAFIPALTNNLISMSGWPDIRAPVHQYQEGVYKEAMSVVDGISDIYSTYDITANFRNHQGNPIMLLFLYWIRWMTLAFEGKLIPYPDDILNCEMCYTTRIYRLILDESKTRVKSLAATGASFPVNIPFGTMFDFEADHPVNPNNDQVSITFTTTGAIYEDPLLLYQFNRTVAMFNPKMLNATVRAARMTKIPIDLLPVFNNRGYPFINPKTMELEWYIDTTMFNQQAGQISAFNSTVPGKVTTP
jgi:hypothetical protein